VKLAISELKDRTGSSLAAIVKWITANYFVPEDKCKKGSVVALKQALAKKVVIRIKASYKLSAAAVKALSLRKRRDKQVAATRVRQTKRRFPVPTQPTATTTHSMYSAIFSLSLSLSFILFFSCVFFLRICLL
jgi:hypothetical protein